MSTILHETISLLPACSSIPFPRTRIHGVVYSQDSLSCCSTSPRFTSPISSSRHPRTYSLQYRSRARVCANAKLESEVAESSIPERADDSTAKAESSSSKKVDVDQELAKVVRKTAATFAPRPSTKSSNPAVPGSLLYKIFEVQGYLSMGVGGLLSFNLIFPSDEPDLWRLMGMWSIWMFTVPSLRARDCSLKEKDALNFLFLAIPLINVTLPLVWRSFAAVWTADVVAFFAIYAWKMEWINQSDSKESA
eukprot:TRINITY_DN23934_c0_g1_i1.p1 TRINITY_DN23934_c0_g1~~TRINITY_DN23934_c0_g1_i1.p1  ORF type:complete len:250 (-),score=31.00 TRINITY_DN23934_c0_g1_i1:329-1078(-)